MVFWLGIKFEIATCFLSGLKFLVIFCCWKVNSFVWLIFLCGNLFFPLCFKNICCGWFFLCCCCFLICFCLGVDLIYSAGEWLMLYYFKSNSCLLSWKYSLSPFSLSSSSIIPLERWWTLSFCPEHLFTFLSYFIAFCFSVLYFKLFT